jgi:LL-diaminopimelate aminotransferase
MVTRNANIAKLARGYLFPEIAKRRLAFQKAHPEIAGDDASQKIISLGIGNTTEPLLPHVCAGLTEGAARLGTSAGYSGYQDEGMLELREKIAVHFYKNKFAADEVFISDGAKCDIARLQLLFGSGVKVAVQDPAYPAYVDGSVIAGAGGGQNASGVGYSGITYLPCIASNNFFPDLSLLPNDGLFYFCSPNNPTGATATKAELEKLVEAVKQKGCFLIFDAAYSEYIRDAALPKTIYEIDGAETCAIEVNSFSKSLGFTGVRLGWSVVPRALKWADGGSVHSDWSRLCATIFNGASNIAQYGGLRALDGEGLAEIKALTDFYMGNAALIRSALLGLSIKCCGGDNSPYIWAHFPGRDSWDVFSDLLERYHVVTTPGSGFGPAGESYIRFSAFGHREDIVEACRRLGGKPRAIALNN